ncbi:MAG: AbrB/MazE/SpoVT family DNA-binding domain-containing protein [Clostridia bacterium]|nr:AbrB/MazE/SpoVT family DNA-binding domain-containing protein [Clostridia bacterium]
MKINKILGERGRITIPYEIRLKMGFKYNDVVSFEEQDNNTVIIRREKICDGCKKDAPNPVEKPTDEITLLDFLDGLSVDEQRAVLVHLMTKWTDLLWGDKNA